MKSLVLLSLAVGTLAGCDPKPTEPSKSSVAKAAPTTPFARDVQRICNVEEESGALHEEVNARAQHTAIWLATNLESEEGRELSRQLVQLEPEPRKARLRRVADEQKIGECETVRTW